MVLASKSASSKISAPISMTLYNSSGCNERMVAGQQIPTVDDLMNKLLRSSAMPTIHQTIIFSDRRRLRNVTVPDSEKQRQ
ncbi:hypothetical protein BA1DRAFT_02365 [Photorhabdus aegyptia]|uniref:Uncharacterized protein n=1 Tax=Photorhabdus aegyptia TaxID=2805098 RepID=A0A022PKQ0_9GAMM|nr:hypothetical protein BA1DRAFT_02365 [Photorhabdus aegyptia]